MVLKEPASLPPGMLGDDLHLKTGKDICSTAYEW
jgi:hypothetical protein